MLGVLPHPTKHDRYPGQTWWYVDLGRDENGKRLRQPFEGSFEEAVRYRATILGGEDEPIRVAMSKVGDLYLPFIDWYKTEHSESTAKDICKTMDRYIIPWFGQLMPGQITLERCIRFRTELLESGLKAVTINKHFNYFSSMLRWGVSQGYCQPLGFELPRFAKKKTVNETEIKPLTPRHIDALYRSIEPEYKCAFLLMADIGLRLNEALTVRIENIDDYAETIRVVGKGRKLRTVMFMTDRAKKEIREKIGDRFEGYLLVNPATGRPYKTLWKPLKRAAAAAGIKQTVNHHVLRHTFGTNNAMKGIKPYALQALMGHSSIDTTMKYYVHLNIDFIAEEAEKVRDR